MNESLTLLAKQIKLNRIKQELPIYDFGLGESPMPLPESIIESILLGYSILRFGSYLSNKNKLLG